MVLSRNFCQMIVRVNSHNFNTVSDIRGQAPDSEGGEDFFGFLLQGDRFLTSKGGISFRLLYKNFKNFPNFSGQGGHSGLKPI